MGHDVKVEQEAVPGAFGRSAPTCSAFGVTLAATGQC